MMDKLIISYEYGYTNWYVSEFYKYFHSKIVDQNKNITFEYMPLSELAKKFDKEYTNQTGNIFNWFNLVIYNEVTDKFFIHSWYDYAPEILNYSVSNGFNLVKFSCVSNLTDSIIDSYKDRIVVEPSVYYLENWSDLNNLKLNEGNNIKKDLAYFNGMNHGVRENILNSLSVNPFFNIRTKNNPEHFRQKQDYYQELSNHRFGLSLNGAANICYRDLELFGLGVLNLRQPLNSKTHNPLIEGVHYKEYITNNLVDKILRKEDVTPIINDMVNEIIDFSTTKEYDEMIDVSKKWFEDNCLPENQFKIISSFLDDFNIFI
jgi:hypothetical protein